MGQNISVSAVTCYGFNNQDSIPHKGRDFFSTPPRPNLPSSPRGFHSNRNRDLFQRGKTAEPWSWL